MRPLRSLSLLCALLLAASAAAAEAAEPARISLVTRDGADGSLRLVAAVQDASGAPVPGMVVTFRAHTAFGWLTLAEVETDAAGTASALLSGPSRYARVQARAGDDAALEAELLLALPSARDPQRRPGLEVLRRMSPQPGFISPYPPVQILVVAVLLGGIWTTYVYVVSLLLRLRRAS